MGVGKHLGLLTGTVTVGAVLVIGGFLYLSNNIENMVEDFAESTESQVASLKAKVDYFAESTESQVASLKETVDDYETTVYEIGEIVDDLEKSFDWLSSCEGYYAMGNRLYLLGTQNDPVRMQYAVNMFTALSEREDECPGLAAEAEDFLTLIYETQAPPEN